MRVRSLCRLLALLALVAFGGSVLADERVSQPYVGITYIDRTEASPRAVHMHIVRIDLTAPGLRFKLSPPSGAREVVRQTTLEYLKQERAQVAVNAHFFLPYPSNDADVWLVGIAASEGRVYSAFEIPKQDYALVANAPGLNVDRANHASIVHRASPRRDGRRVLEPVRLWTTLAGSAQIVTGGVKTVPAYADSQHVGAPLRPGGPDNYSNTHSWYDAVNARTAIGLSRDGRTMTVFTVDRTANSRGMQVGEVADLLMRDYGVWDALNLDGGGSTSLAMQDPVTREPSLITASSDNPAGRAVGSSLAVFARRRP